MGTISEDLGLAVEKAMAASEIMDQVANGPATDVVQTLSGPVPTINKWFSDKEAGVTIYLDDKFNAVIGPVTEQAESARQANYSAIDAAQASSNSATRAQQEADRAEQAVLGIATDLTVTASGTEANPDTASWAAFAGRIAYMLEAKVAVAPALSAGNNVVPLSDFVGDVVDPTVLVGFGVVGKRGSQTVALDWEYLPDTAEIQIDGALEGDVPIAVQRDVGGVNLGKLDTLSAAAEERFEQDLSAAGYTSLGSYAAGLNVASLKEYFKRDGRFYAADENAVLPYSTTGDWSTDSANLMLLGDDVLRQDLALDAGASRVGYKSSLPFSVSQTAKGKLDQLAATPYTFGAVGDGVTDDTAAVVRAFEAGYAFFDGVFKCSPFEITGKQLDVHFAPGAKLVFTHQGSNSATFTNCSGVINGIEIDDPAETVVGIFITLFLGACSDLTVNRPILNGGKDLPVAVYQSDNCHIIEGIGKGTDANRPFAWEMVSCKASTFTRCRLYKYNFGFTLIGPGYKSGSILPSTRSWAETVGMKAVDCYVEDHHGHAFDMNGTVGGGFSGCTAKDYTGTVGNSSFQIKQSTNIPAELDDDTFINWMDNCLAVNCVNGFGTQQGTDVRLTNLQVIRAKRYPVTFNSTKRVSLRGLHVRDWGLDLANWPLQNSDSICAAVAMWNGSDYCVVDDVTLSLADATNPNIGALALCNVVGANNTVGSFRFRQEVGVSGTLARAIRIAGGNTLIDAGFRPGPPGLYSNHPVDDTTGTTMYPLEYGVNVSLSATGTFIVPQVPQRGLLVAKVAAIATATVSGSPQYSVGRNGSVNALISARPAPAASEFLDPLTGTLAANLALAVAVTTAGTGQLSVSIRGLQLL